MHVYSINSNKREEVIRIITIIDLILSSWLEYQGIIDNISNWMMINILNISSDNYIYHLVLSGVHAIVPVGIYGISFGLYNKFIWKWKVLYRWHHIPNLNGKFTCDIQTQKLFESILHDLKFDETHVRIDLKQSYHAKVPCIVGIIHPIVILPVTTYAQEDLKYILIHEIIHYRQKDILLKWISIILCACHFYNPFAWLLLIQIQKWSEFACDYKVCHYTRTVSKYFEVLINAATNDGIKARLASHFVEHKHELVERAKKMKNAYERKKRSKLCAVFVVGMAFVLSSITVSAVTVGSADNYIKLYQETTVSVKDELVQSEEFIEMDHDSNIIIEIGPVNTLAKSNIAFEWNVGDGYRIRTPLFECRENGYVSVAASIVPNNVRVRIGIGREDGYCKYIISQGSVGHVFNIPSDGDYYFYVENASGTAVTVSGSYVMP